MERTILSVRKQQFKQDDGTTREMYQVYCADDTGAVGCIYSSTPYVAGQVVILGLAVNRDGRFTARILG